MGLQDKSGYFWGSPKDLPWETGNSFSESSFGSQRFLADGKGLKSSLLGQCWARHGLHEMPTYSCPQSNVGRSGMCRLVSAAFCHEGRDRGLICDARTTGSI